MRAPPRWSARTASVVASRCALGESPLWLSAERGLRWVDAERGRLHSLRAGRHESWQVTDGTLSAVAAAGGGDLLVTVDRAVWRVADRPGGAPLVLAELPDPPRFNDAKVGPDGRLWAGTVDRARPRAGALWSLAAGGQLRRHWTGIGHGNGIAWSPAGDILYVVDSAAGTLSRGPFDPVLGPGEPTVILELPRRDGIPDGLTVDAEGDLWLAVWGGGCLLRLAPDGTPLGGVDLPERNVTSAAFAGPDLGLLAVTTAADEVDPSGPGGSVRLLDVGRRGLPGHEFGKGR